MSRSHFWTSLLPAGLSLLAVLLTGCGGSGGSGGPSATPSTDGNWSQQAYLKAPNAGASDYFGGSVAIRSDTIVAGAAFEASNQTTITNGSTASADNSLSLVGAAYVVKRSH